MTKDEEIREYSIKENVFFGAWEAAKMGVQLSHIPQGELMAAVIELAEEYANVHLDGNVEEYILFVRSRLNALIKNTK